MMINRRTLLLVLGVVLLIGSSWNRLTGSGRSTDQPPLRIAVSPWAGFAHAFVAAEKGLFARHGVNVQLVVHATQSHSDDSYKSNGADGVFTVLTNVIVMAIEDIPTQAVYVTDYSQSGDVILARPGLQSLHDLKGHTVSIDSLHSFSHIYVLEALQHSGLNEGVLRFKVVPAPDVLAAMERGEIDAGHTWQPVTSHGLAKGYQVLSKAGDMPGIISDVLAFSTRVIRERPRDVQAIVRALLEAREYIRLHPEESVSIMARFMGMSAEEMSRSLAEIRELGLQENTVALAQGDDHRSLYYSGQHIMRSLLDYGLAWRTPDLDEVINPTFITKLAQERQP